MAPKPIFVETKFLIDIINSSLMESTELKYCNFFNSLFYSYLEYLDRFNICKIRFRIVIKESIDKNQVGCIVIKSSLLRLERVYFFETYTLFIDLSAFNHFNHLKLFKIYSCLNVLIFYNKIIIFLISVLTFISLYWINKLIGQ